jgi:hypothetical protein
LEEWAYIQEYKGKYIISSYGRIINLKNVNNGTMKEMKPYKRKNGGFQISLSMNGKMKMHHVHRLLAQAFIPNPENKPCINHKDGNRNNNHLSNLEWCTYLENNRHAIDTGLRRGRGKNKCKHK